MQEEHNEVKNPSACVITFTQCELKCIYYALQGSRLSYIAKILQLTRHSVYFHLQNVHKKIHTFVEQSE